MATDYLTMSKNVAQMAGLSGNIGGVTGQTGDIARIIRFVRESCVYVEALWGDWKFLYGGRVPITLQPGLDVYSVPSEYQVYRWNKNAMYLDRMRVPHCAVFEYHEAPEVDMMGNSGTPMSIVIMPDNSLRFVQTPDRSYEFVGDFYKRPKILAVNTDVPNIPQEFCPVIEAEALRRYANYDNAQELKTEAAESYSTWLALLEADQRPGGTASNTAYGNDIVIQAR